MHWVISQAQEWLAKPGIANAFGLILYTERHAHTSKLLHDDTYWQSLNDLTGERWPVFVIKRPAGEFVSPKARVPGDLSLLVPLYKDPKENRDLLKQLGLESSEDPYLVVYSVLNATDVLRHTVRLSEKSYDEAYAALKEALGAATRAIEDVHDKNLKDAEGVNAAVGLLLDHLKHVKILHKTMPLVGLVQKIFKAIHGAG